MLTIVNRRKRPAEILATCVAKACPVPYRDDGLLHRPDDEPRAQSGVAM